jgi:predicted nuclease with TOPRIM domain
MLRAGADEMENRHRTINSQNQRIAELQRENARLREDAAEHAALDAETEAGLEQIEHERDEAIRRADALERTVNGKTQTINALATLAAEYVALEDANAACSASDEQVNEARQRLLDEISQCRAALAQQEPDQPAQDGGRLDPYTLERAAEAMESLAGTVDEDDGPYFEGYRDACTDGEVNIRDLQLDQPADAGEPSCCARTREEHEALARLRWVLWDADPDSIRIARDDPGMNADWQKICAAIRRIGDTGGEDD